MPASELARYSVDRDPDTEEGIARYVEIEVPDETVQHVEWIKSEAVMGEKYDVWDVTTDKERWWVMGNLTNLYPQKYFPSLDYTLSFHIGLMMRIRSRPSGASADEPTPFDEVFRRQEQAKDRYDRAVESEDFQAVGVQLRECLLSLLPALRRHVTVPPQVAPPQEGNFIAWYNVLMDALCGGRSNKELRQYLKSTARDTWQLVGWLVHDRNASRHAAVIAIHACDNVVGHSVQVLGRHEVERAKQCPLCRSRDIRSHFDPYVGDDDGASYLTCGSCGWTNHPERPPGQSQERADSQETEDTETPTG